MPTWAWILIAIGTIIVLLVVLTLALVSLLQMAITQDEKGEIPQ